MDTIELLISAIEQKKQVSYEYDSPGRAVGVRIGNPHAIFISKAENVNIDIYKTDGVKTDPTKPLPAWRQYKIKDIKNVVILDKGFSTADGYNPTSKQYARVLALI
ncbi:hypothetical protein [Parasediminibacterium sp. JCM 36343]|uniref:hypothetical protein n=1 Tax=Parasediminibacterium sp. JCM 36343 TaxID=3374279 RepID=UPI00397B1726